MSPNRMDVQQNDSESANPPDALGARLRNLRSVCETRERPIWRRRILVIIAMMVLSWLILVVGAVWRLHGNSTRLKDGWYRIVDRQWGCEFELPDWSSKRADWSKASYHARIDPSRTTVDVSIEKWYPQKNGATVGSTFRDAVKAGEVSGTVKVLLDRTSDSEAPTIDYLVANSIWATRYRFIFYRGTIIRIVIHGANYTPEDVQQRVIDSVRWLP